MLFLPSSKHLALMAVFAAASLAVAPGGYGFTVDESPQPATHPPEAPLEGERVESNPPSLVWRNDERASAYEVEFSTSPTFNSDTRRVTGIPYPFFNDAQPLAPGRWYWRHYVRDGAGKLSRPGRTQSFIVTEDAPILPLPGPEALIAGMPGHPRVFVTPQSLPAFREKRNGPAKEAWERIQQSAEHALRATPRITGKQIPLAEAKIRHNKVSQSHSWKKGDPVRRQVFLVHERDGIFWLPGYSYRDFNRDAERANLLSFAYLISGEKKYANGARQWLEFVSRLRLDRHLDAGERAGHDTVVYAIEQGLKAAALSYDRLYDELSEEERRGALNLIEYHVDSAGRWIRDSQSVHLEFQKSHVQQCMHTLLVTVLAAAGDSKEIDGWVQYLVPQYVNRIAWISRDGGYFEGQTYGHKFGWILEGLAAIRSATGIDLFQKPALRNAGTYWLYAMNLNYWYQHWGDNYSLIWPHANPRDGYISAFLAADTKDPYVKWYADTVLTDPENVPFRYLSDSGLQAKPPVDIAQARAFPDTGALAAYDRFYDHRSTRVFFRSSPWGAHSHSHADQNGFVLHSGGEILAPDTGYYTYSGDLYHANWSKSTFAHNSMLVNGKPQPSDIGSKGEIASFFHGGKMTYWMGDASRAYESPLKTFRRAMLFLRPATTIVYDELEASQPSAFSWLLNTFAAPEIDATRQRMIIPQQEMRLQVEHLLPLKPEYTSDNKRPYPVKTPGRMWSRVTEAFPQPWHNRVTSAPARETSFLALLQAYRNTGQKPAATRQTVASATTIGLSFTTSSGEEGIALFRKRLAAEGGSLAATLEGVAITANAEAAAFVGAPARPDQWLVGNGRHLVAGGQLLWQSEHPVSAAFSQQTPAAKAMLRVDGMAGHVALHLPNPPGQLILAPANHPEQGRELSFTWDEKKRIVAFTLSDAGEHALWIDPAVDLAAPIPKAHVRITDSAGSYELPLSAAWAEDGEWIYFAQATPREAGLYQFEQPGNGTRELLVSDRWAPMTQSSSGALPLTSTFREGSTLFFHAPPALQPPTFTATLKQSSAGSIDNLLSNGGFEEGIPLFPPRGWTFQQERPEKQGWPEWSQEGAVEGKACLHYRADGEAATLQSQPVRLLTDGTYHLRLKAKGDIAGCRVVARSSSGKQVVIALKPGEAWEGYEASGELSAGYCSLTIQIPAAKAKESLWVDAIEFGKIAPPPTPSVPEPAANND